MSQDEEQEAAAMLVGQFGVDGLLIAGDFPGDTTTIQQILEYCPHVIALCRSLDPHVVPVVRIDDRQATEQLLKYLLGLGHRRIGFIGLERPGSFTHRYVAYRDFMAAHDLLVSERLVGLVNLGSYFPSLDEFVDLGVELAHRVLGSGEPVDALFCACDALALGALRVARERGLVVPRDLSVVGIDDIPLARYCTPSLTTMRQPVVEMGRHAVTLLIDVIEGAVARPSEAVLFPAELVVRESAARPSTAAGEAAAALGVDRNIR